MQSAANSYICDLNPYQLSASQADIVRRYGHNPSSIVVLASNENPLGMSPKACEAAERVLPGAYRYPEQSALIAALADRLDVPATALVLGNGSNDVLDMVARVFLDEGYEAVSAQYAFAVYNIATTSVGATNVTVPLKDFQHDLPAMLAAITPKTRVVWLVNPGNPIGTFIPYGEIKQFLDRVPKEVAVVLDEAYYEYLAPDDRADSISWLRGYPNLIIVRTFSKMYGMAGLRLGYGITSPEIADLMNRVRHPFNVNVLALAAGVAALDDHEFVERSRQNAVAGRKQLLDGLRTMGLECLPSYSNFVNVRVLQDDIHEALLSQGIIVRPLTGYGLSDWLRVTIGLPEENEQFLQAMRHVLRG